MATKANLTAKLMKTFATLSQAVGNLGVMQLFNHLSRGAVQYSDFYLPSVANIRTVSYPRRVAALRNQVDGLRQG